eukprot:COSAG02_NODE_1650_length_11487_cov_13.602895_10_plen_87_part_00
MLSLVLGAFGIIMVAGKLQVSVCSAPLACVCPFQIADPAADMLGVGLLQPISLSAILDGASTSFEDFNPDFMVFHHRGRVGADPPA